MVEFAMHELTHSLERTGAYKQYHDTVLNILYPSKAELTNAVAQMMSNREAAGHPINEAQAERELVAEFTRLRLAGLPAVVKNAVTREGRALAGVVAEHVLASYRSRDPSFPLEPAKLGIAPEGEAAARAAVREVAKEIAEEFDRTEGEEEPAGEEPAEEDGGDFDGVD